MYLDYNEKELESLMKDFYLLTGIRIVLFDSAYKELSSYPKQHCKFCDKMKSKKETSLLCDESDQASFAACKEKNELIIYHCHAGLIEAAAPLIDHNTVIGYMMFGQISDAETAEELISVLKKNVRFSPEEAEDISQYTSDIPLKNTEQIKAAAKIMQACTFYAIFKKTIRIRRDNFIHNMDQYLSEHLSEDLSISALSAALGISKSKLYQNCTYYYGCGIAQHIRSLRIETAKKLLVNSDMSVTDISEKAGFTDYNYFCRIFKKEVGTPAKKYRQFMQK